MVRFKFRCVNEVAELKNHRVRVGNKVNWQKVKDYTYRFVLDESELRNSKLNLENPEILEDSVLRMGGLKEKLFSVGQEYFIDITPVEEVQK